MIRLRAYVFRSLADLRGLVALWIRPLRSLEAEPLFLRRQLASIKSGASSLDAPMPRLEMRLVLLSKLFDWRCALIIVRPETLIRWHRAGW